MWCPPPARCVFHPELPLERSSPMSCCSVNASHCPRYPQWLSHSTSIWACPKLSSSFHPVPAPSRAGLAFTSPALSLNPSPEFSGLLNFFVFPNSACLPYLLAFTYTVPSVAGTAVPSLPIQGWFCSFPLFLNSRNKFHFVFIVVIVVKGAHVGMANFYLFFLHGFICVPSLSVCLLRTHASLFKALITLVICLGPPSSWLSSLKPEAVFSSLLRL